MPVVVKGAMVNQQKEWLTVRDVAELLSVTEETVRRWIRNSELPVLDLGTRKGGYRIHRPDLDAFIQQRYGRVGKAVA